MNLLITDNFILSKQKQIMCKDYLDSIHSMHDKERVLKINLIIIKQC